MSLFSSPIWLASLSLNHFFVFIVLHAYYIFLQIICIYMYDIGQNIYFTYLLYLLTYFTYLLTCYGGHGPTKMSGYFVFCIVSRYLGV